MSIKRINVGQNHRYTIDGRKAGGVTTLIKKGLPAPALMYWSAKMVAEFVADADPELLASMRQSLGRDGLVNALKAVPWDRRDKAAVRGTQVHALAEKLITGEPVDVPDELAGHVESCVKFLDEWQPSPVLVESVIANRRWSYAGTLDLVADLCGDRRALMDYKTTASGIWPETALQLAAYRHADVYLDDDGNEQSMAAVGINCAYAVWLRADGYDVIPVDTSVDVFRAFCHVRNVAMIADQMKAWVGESEAA